MLRTITVYGETRVFAPPTRLTPPVSLSSLLHTMINFQPLAPEEAQISCGGAIESVVSRDHGSGIEIEYAGLWIGEDQSCRNSACVYSDYIANTVAQTCDALVD